jgi:hypothetical protein
VGVLDRGTDTSCDRSSHGIVRIPRDYFQAMQLTFIRYIFAKFQESLEPNKPRIALSKAIPVYLTLFIFGFLYQLVLVYDSLRLKNTIQVLGLCAYDGGMLIYAAIQYDQVNKAIQQLAIKGYVKPNTDVWADIQPYLAAVPCIIAFFAVSMSVIAWKLYDEFAWTIYKHISADLRMKRRYLTFQVCINTSFFISCLLTNF